MKDRISRWTIGVVSYFTLEHGHFVGRFYKLGITHRQVMRFVAKLDLCPNDYCKRKTLCFERESHNLTLLEFSRNSSSSHVINFYDAFASKEPIKTNSIPSGASKLIDKMNLHPCFLSILGILPNQLRTLLKDTGHQHREEALDDLSRTLFFSGYDIWAKRQCLSILGRNRIRKSQYLPQINKET